MPPMSSKSTVMAKPKQLICWLPTAIEGCANITDSSKNGGRLDPRDSAEIARISHIALLRRVSDGSRLTIANDFGRIEIASLWFFIQTCLNSKTV
jgi:hypothetical protein